MAEDDKQSETGFRQKHGDPGIAGRMAAAFIHSPLSSLLLIASIAIGILGLMVTPRQEDPQISVPMVDIMVSYPGVPSEQVASLAARPLERLLSELSGVDNVYSVSHRGEAMVTVQFDVGEDMESSIVKVHDKLFANRDLMPPGVSEPMVKAKGADDVPVVNLTFWSHEVDDALLRQIALDAQQQLNETPDTSQSFVVSGREERLRIEVLPERLAGYDISLDDIAQAVQSANVEGAAGRIESGGLSTAVYTGRFFTGAADLEQLLIAVSDGQPVYLRDVAEVTYGPGDLERFVRHYSGPAAPEPDAAPEGAAAVTLAIAKKSGSNGVTVANDVLERLERLKGSVIPDNVEVAVSRNYGKSANEKVNELLFKLFIATFAVTILVGLFLGIRAAVVVLIVIPVVILFTVFSAWLLGYTIDRVSLFALIFSIGILVDDAIVVVENIYRRWLMKRGIDTETTVDAVREVGNPTILATFTVIAALLPMGFVSGMMGPYMQPIPVLGSVAMLFSLVAAFVFTPWLTQRLRPSMAYLEKATDKEHRQAEKLGRFYRTVIPGLADNRVRGYAFLIAVIVIFFLMVSLFMTTDVRVKMLPLDNKPEFQVMVNFPEGTALTETATLSHDMASVLREMDEVVALQSYVGTASPFNFNGLVRHYYLRNEPWQGDIQVQLVDKGDRSRTSHDIATEARERLTPLAEAAGARIQVVEMPPGPPVLQSLVAEVYGPDAATRRGVARDLEGMFAGAEHVADVDSFLQAPHNVWHFDVDRDKALRRGVTVDTINRTLETAIGGQILGDVKAQSLVEPHLIEMRLPMATRNDIRQLEMLPISTRQGGSIPLAELGEFVQRPQDEPIYHKNLRPVEYVTGEVVGRLAAPVYGMLEVQEQLEDYRLPDGSQVQPHWLGPPPNDGSTAFEWAGEWTVTYVTFRDMGIAFAIALILIYMLVVWEFGNFVLPGIIMAPIPLTLIGIIPGHWLMNAEFTATSMIGFIALAGIIVRNSILLVDFGRQAVDEGHDVRDAMILACQARTRPIIITALALLAGSSVILFDPIFQGMAISLMFGTVVATLLTLVVIPLGCISGRRAFCPASLDEDGAVTAGCGNGNGNGHAVHAGVTASPTQGASPGAYGEGNDLFGPREGGPVTQVVQYAGLYLKCLVVAFIEGLRDLALALGRLIRSFIERRRNGDGGPPPPSGGSGGPFAGPGGPTGGAPGSGGASGTGSGGGAATPQSRSENPSADSKPSGPVAQAPEPTDTPERAASTPATGNAGAQDAGAAPSGRAQAEKPDAGTAKQADTSRTTSRAGAGKTTASTTPVGSRAGKAGSTRGAGDSAGTKGTKKSPAGTSVSAKGKSTAAASKTSGDTSVSGDATKGRASSTNKGTGTRETGSASANKRASTASNKKTGGASKTGTTSSKTGRKDSGSTPKGSGKPGTPGKGRTRRGIRLK
ncbi:efflux RND transporter permease subunit [Thioalkalivibrio sp. ALM2T]|uniref:efflux RND transporter permease subunit n=1 Tax=Thioalkalivibrio sp. ALM2T TaxID=1158184 RepID=UPI00037F88F2|nr:efflux RND transporter permease subunit [Thioalkalivibrio sp. ALM2T]